MQITDIKRKEIDKLKIGKLVKGSMTDILKNEQISENEVQNLLRKDYSKLNFNVIFPILKQVDKTISLQENKIVNGHPRYYAKPIEFKKIEYLLTNEWKEYHRDNFISWLERKVKDL